MIRTADEARDDVAFTNLLSPIDLGADNVKRAPKPSAGFFSTAFNPRLREASVWKRQTTVRFHRTRFERDRPGLEVIGLESTTSTLRT